MYVFCFQCNFQYNFQCTLIFTYIKEKEITELKNMLINNNELNNCKIRAIQDKYETLNMVNIGKFYEI